jgi:hypothetical protein
VHAKYRVWYTNTKRTNVPDIAMSFSDSSFSYGPFVPHYVPRQYIENYFSIHKTDEYLSLGTTVEDLSQLPAASRDGLKTWKLTLRKYDRLRHVDIWWREEFDAVILANGHYSVPWVFSSLQFRDSRLTNCLRFHGFKATPSVTKIAWEAGRRWSSPRDRMGNCNQGISTGRHNHFQGWKRAQGRRPYHLLHWLPSFLSFLEQQS